MKMKISILVSVLLSASHLFAQGQTGVDRNKNSSQSQPAKGASQSSTSGALNQQSDQNAAQNQQSRSSTTRQSSQSTQPSSPSLGTSTSTSSQGQSSTTTSPSGIGAAPSSQSSAGTQPGQSSIGASSSSTSPSSTQPTLGTQSSSSRAGAQTGSSTQPGSLQPGSLNSQTSSQTGSRLDTAAQGRPGAPETGQQATANVQVNQQHVTQLQNAFASLKTGGTAQNQQLTQTIMSIAPGSKVSQTYVTRFVTDLGTVLPRVTLSAPAQQRLASTIAYVLTPNVQATQLEPMLTQVREVLVQSGVPAVAAQTVACDLHLMAAEAHPELLEVRVSP
jgi:hypothetical protein